MITTFLISHENILGKHSILVRNVMRVTVDRLTNTTEVCHGQMSAKCWFY